ncbi:hypothetical protein ACTVZO_39160 [Streptomyces sp. IBSNAI002]|uniref:hypothetical protein n=1 Tax=Streptomyces sp. IBSNAI002 TaxID=3457500 RepID=UPI003FD19BDA
MESEISVTPHVLFEGSDEEGNPIRRLQWQCHPSMNGHILQEVWFSAAGSTPTVYWEAWRVQNGIVQDAGGSPLADAAHCVWSAPSAAGDWHVQGNVYWAADFRPEDEGFVPVTQAWFHTPVLRRASGPMCHMTGLFDHHWGSGTGHGSSEGDGEADCTVQVRTCTVNAAFHGTTPESANSIRDRGFTVGGRRLHGRRYGDGVYFTENAKTARGYSKAGNERGVGPVIEVAVTGKVAWLDERELDAALKRRDLSGFPFAESSEQRAYLLRLLDSQDYEGSTSPMVSVGTFLSQMGYSAMYLHPWKEVVVFDTDAIKLLGVEEFEPQPPAAEHPVPPASRRARRTVQPVDAEESAPRPRRTRPVDAEASAPRRRRAQSVGPSSTVKKPSKPPTGPVIQPAPSKKKSGQPKCVIS